MCPVRRGNWQEACLSSRQPIAKKCARASRFRGGAGFALQLRRGGPASHARRPRFNTRCINTRLSRILGTRPVTIEKSGAVWTVMLSRPQARNAVNPETATKLYDAFLAFHREGAGAARFAAGAGRHGERGDNAPS